MAAARNARGLRSLTSRSGLNQLDLVGEVPVTITALGPWATYVSAMIVEAEGVVYGNAPARLKLAGRAGAG